MKSRLTGGFGFTDFRFMITAMGCVSFMLIVGCKKENIHSYRVPREVGGGVASMPQQQGDPTESFASNHDVAWTVPASWHEVETTSDMRIATFHTEIGLEVAVTAFPGDVGGLVANVNRWRGQVGLESTDEQGVEENIERLDGVDVIIVDVSGVDARLVGSVINVGDGQTWFVKATGPSETVGQLKADLIEFSNSFHVHKHDGGSAIETQAGDQAGQPSDITTSWEQPTQWRLDPNASPILMAAYFADDGARITLTSLSGDGGGVLNNINRWRGQLGLAIVASLDDQPSKDLGLGAILVDLVSPDGANRMVAGIVPLSSQSLYFKMTGTTPQVENELERFEGFIQGVAMEGRVDP